MSKNKDKATSAEHLSIRHHYTVSEKLDEIIDLLHVLVENTKEPEPVKVTNFNIPDEDRRLLREADLQRLYAANASARKPDPRGKPQSAAEAIRQIAPQEVEDYLGIATTDPYTPPVRVHR